MRIVTAISRFDIDKLHLQTEVHLSLGNLLAHDILLVPTPAAKQAAFEVAAKLGRVCNTIQVADMDVEPEEGWPCGPNQHFAWTLNHMALNGMHEAFLWLEPDCIGRVPQWADKIAMAYQTCGQPFMGCIVQAPGRNFSDTMMMGCGVYPPRMLQDVIIGPVAKDLAKRGQYHPEQPWDVYLCDAFRQRGMADTKLIADQWNTGNYRLEGGSLVCDALPTAIVARPRGGVISPEAVMIHGCKDGSLQRLILGQAPLPPVQIAPPPAPVLTPAESGIIPTIPVTAPTNEDGDETLSPEEAAALLAAVQEKAPEQEPAPEGKSAVTISPEQIRAIIAVRPTRTGHMAKALGIPYLALQELLPKLGFYEAGVWVKEVKRELVEA